MPISPGRQEMWRRRTATLAGCLALALAALAFAWLADQAQHVFARWGAPHPLIMIGATPLLFALVTGLTARWWPDARSSGIPQVIALVSKPERAATSPILSLPTAAAKALLTAAVLACGGLVGREGPTVQISAAINVFVHKRFKVPITAGVLIAGGAAGVAAAFNTPLAGVAFAIEELASAYEQRLAALVMMAVMIAGFVTLSVAGDYLYFGAVHANLPLRYAITVTPLLGIVGGGLGGLFSRAMQVALRPGASLVHRLRRRPALFAGICGLVVGLMLWLSEGTSWGTGYSITKSLVEGVGQPWWIIFPRAAATLATAVSGTPGGIFVPSLTLGAELGNIAALAFPAKALGPIAMIGMITYFTGVVRAPLTAVIIVSEATGGHGLIIPLFAAALIADATSALVCPEKLYHGLSKSFRAAEPDQ